MIKEDEAAIISLEELERKLRFVDLMADYIYTKYQ